MYIIHCTYIVYENTAAILFFFLISLRSVHLYLCTTGKLSCGKNVHQNIFSLDVSQLVLPKPNTSANTANFKVDKLEKN